MEWYKGLTVAKDPGATLDWRWDFTDWLGAGDTVSTAVATPATGIAVDSYTADTTGVNVVLSGGTAGTSYDVTVQVTTAAGLKDERTVTFEVSDQ